MSPTRPRVRPPPLALVVEDHSDTREMYAEWLTHSGFRVVQSATAEDALNQARRLHPDIITTDIGLHGASDGCQLCEDLKNDKRTERIPVVAVTGWNMGGHVERARRAGCNAVLVKPVLPETLLTEILRLLNGADQATTQKPAVSSHNKSAVR